MKFSKNMYWWVVSVVALVAMVLNAIMDQWIISALMALMFVISGSQYFKYRKAGK